MRYYSAVLYLYFLFFLFACVQQDEPIKDKETGSDSEFNDGKDKACPEELITKIKNIKDKRLGIGLAKLAQDIDVTEATKRYSELKEKCKELLKNYRRYQGCSYSKPNEPPEQFDQEICDFQPGHIKLTA